MVSTRTKQYGGVKEHLSFVLIFDFGDFQQLTNKISWKNNKNDVAQSEEYEIFFCNNGNRILPRSELYIPQIKEKSEMSKRDSERISRINIFENERFVDKRND